MRNHRSYRPKIDATARALYALMDDLHDMHEAAERVQIQIHALAAHHGVAVPRPITPP